MYTYYFQEVATLAGQRFILTAAKSHATGTQPTDRSQRFSEEHLRMLVSAGYRVVIDPTPERQRDLNNAWRYSEERHPAELKLAEGFRAIYPTQMFAVERGEMYTDFAARTSRGIPCGIMIDRVDTPGGEFKQTITEVPAAGALPPQAPISTRTETVDEYGVPEVGTRTEYFKSLNETTKDLREAQFAVVTEFLTTDEIYEKYGIVVVDTPGVRGWTPADGYCPVTEAPIPPDGSMLLPKEYEGKPVLQGPVSLSGPKDREGKLLPYEGELPENARLVPIVDEPKSFWQKVLDFFSTPTSETIDE